MNAKFQAIQSAHEVLTDPLERQRYDDMRSRVRYTTASAFRSTKGNPYSNYGSEFPRPPKPPPYRPNRNPPPQSAGAARYSTFQTPRQSASAAAQEGPEARKSTFNAWESMKGHQKTSSASYRTGSGPTWNTPKAGPREHVSQPSRTETSGFKIQCSPRPKPGFEEFRSDSYHTRNPSNPPPIPKRNGFMPSNPGADEPSAGKGNYSTSRINRSVPPPPPPRETPSPEQEDEEIHTPAPAPPVNHTTRPSTKPNDPLRQFRTGEDPPYEPRLKNTPKNDTPKNDTPKNDTPKNDNPENDTPKNDTPKNDTPKNDTPKNDTPKDGAQKPTPAFATSSDSSDSGNGPEIKSSKTTNGPPAQEEPKPQPSIFSMKLDDGIFSPTQPNTFPRSSADRINTKFSSEEWHGKFEAGGDYFVPEQKTTQIPLHSRVRTQSSSSRSRGRSPVKSRSADSKPFPSRPSSDTPIESPGGTKFSAQDWAETFKPQTFAPPSVPSPNKASVPSRIGSRKPRLPIAKATAGSATIVIEDDSDDSDGKPLFKGRVPSAPKPPTSPDAMDVDSPPATPAPPPAQAPPAQAPPAQAPPAQAPPAQAPPAQAPPAQAQSPKANSGLKINTEQLKRAAAPSQSPVDTESLKVEFDDLNIKELLSSLDLPPPPIAPKYSHESNTALSQGIYLSAFTAYMVDWDLFAKRMMLHLVARKNQNDGLGSNRWENPQGLDIYRRGLKEDGAVMSHWVAAMASHDQAMKEYAIHKERFNMAEGRDRIDQERNTLIGTSCALV
ncbi:hypothetical protein DID88_000113 [Monilinia fructigena]|uniref:J domain-containing protein n=1 Tax=Monilinia fructigena TaxID=38457 RepID=A0A395IJ59_9HELO|nr:hypothetical protein DID88_000113 [Monilinia fructigena]